MSRQCGASPHCNNPIATGIPRVDGNTKVWLRGIRLRPRARTTSEPTGLDDLPTIAKKCGDLCEILHVRLMKPAAVKRECASLKTVPADVAVAREALFRFAHCARFLGTCTRFAVTCRPALPIANIPLGQAELGEPPGAWFKVCSCFKTWPSPAAQSVPPWDRERNPPACPTRDHSLGKLFGQKLPTSLGWHRAGSSSKSKGAGALSCCRFPPRACSSRFSPTANRKIFQRLASRLLINLLHRK